MGSVRYYRVTRSFGFGPDGGFIHSVYTVRIKNIGSPGKTVFSQTSKENQGLSDHMSAKLANSQYIFNREKFIPYDSYVLHLMSDNISEADMNHVT